MKSLRDAVLLLGLVLLALTVRVSWQGRGAPVPGAVQAAPPVVALEESGDFELELDPALCPDQEQGLFRDGREVPALQRSVQPAPLSQQARTPALEIVVLPLRWAAPRPDERVPSGRVS